MDYPFCPSPPYVPGDPEVAQTGCVAPDCAQAKDEQAQNYE